MRDDEFVNLGSVERPEEVHGGNVAEVTRLYGLDPRKLIDFSANINPLGPSPLALKSIIRNLDGISRYPDTRCQEMLECLSDYLSIEADRIVPGNGATELIHLIVRLIRPSRTLVPAPSFSEYARAVRNVGGRVQYLELRVGEIRGKAEEFFVSPEKLRRLLPEVELVFLCNPNNPTGTVVCPEKILSLMDGVRENGPFFVVDEAFIDFTGVPEALSLRRYAAEMRNLFVIGSLTKYFALPGLRIGYGIGRPDLINKMWLMKEPWSVNALAQVAAVASLRDLEYIERTRSVIREEREFLFAALQRIPRLRPHPSAANYFLVDVRETGLTGGELREALIGRGVLVRDCASFQGLDEYYIRVAVRTRGENLQLLTALAEVTAGRGTDAKLVASTRHAPPGAG